MTNQLLPDATELAAARSEDLLDAALKLATLAFDSARTDTDPLTKDELLEQVAATQRVANSALATQAVRIAQAASHEEVFDPSIADTRTVRHHLGFTAPWIDTEIAPLLALGARQASTRIQHALDAVTRAPRLLAQAGTGSLDPTKIGVITDQLAGASRTTHRAIERAMLAQGIHRLTSTQLRRRVPKLLAQLEPATVAPAAKKRRRDHVGVFTRPHHEPGLAELVAILPTQDIAAAQRAIDELARHLHTDTTTDKTLAECRADAFIDLLLHNVGIDTTILFQLPVRPTGCETHSHTSSFGEHSDGAVARSTGDTLDDELRALLDDILGPTPDGTDPASGPLDTSYLRESERPGDLDDHDQLYAGIDWDQLLSEARAQHSTPPPAGTLVATKPSPPDTRRRYPSPPFANARFDDVTVPGVGVIPAEEIALLTRTIGTRMTRALTDPATGTTIETTTRKYRPTAAIRRHVITRDSHCRFPGCSMPATRCDQDHVTPWPAGATTPNNLHSLCRHHHRAKHESAWTVSMTPDGICTWTSPTGRNYRTTPGD